MNYNNFIGEKMYKLYDFYMDSCSPCKMIAPKVENFIKDKSNISFNAINISNPTDFSKAEKYGILSVPTLLLFEVDGDNEKEIFRGVGIDSINELEKKWNDLCQQEKK
ncbi:MAG: thioredoxin family protein [Elusimicrobiota bacterium]|jgi:thioredoxin 1|nr:thioredoxin family protein [Elusimicrobiota bacterium]